MVLLDDVWCFYVVCMYVVLCFLKKYILHLVFLYRVQFHVTKYSFNQKKKILEYKCTIRWVFSFEYSKNNKKNYKLPMNKKGFNIYRKSAKNDAEKSAHQVLI